MRESVTIKFGSVEEFAEQTKQVVNSDQPYCFFDWPASFDNAELGMALQPLRLGVMKSSDEKYGFACTPEFYNLVESLQEGNLIDRLQQAIKIWGIETVKLPKLRKK